MMDLARPTRRWRPGLVFGSGRGAVLESRLQPAKAGTPTHHPKCGGSLACAVFALLLAAPAARADDGPPAEEIFRDNRTEVVQGAATLAGAGCQGGHGTAMVLGLLMRGDRLHLWKLE